MNDEKPGIRRDSGLPTGRRVSRVLGPCRGAAQPSDAGVGGASPSGAGAVSGAGPSVSAGGAGSSAAGAAAGSGGRPARADDRLRPPLPTTLQPPRRPPPGPPRPRPWLPCEFGLVPGGGSAGSTASCTLRESRRRDASSPARSTACCRRCPESASRRGRSRRCRAHEQRGDDLDAQLARFEHRDVLAVRVDHHQCLGQPVHVANAGEVALDLLALAREASAIIFVR